MRKEIEVHLRKDPKIAAVLDEVRPYSLPDEKRTVFEATVRAIVGQQISTKAAAKIYERLLDMLDRNKPRPEKILEADDEALRAVGLSQQKASYVRSIASFFTENQDLDWHALSDEEAQRQLVSIRGVGEWTAQMVLMFTLEREDIFAPGDLGIQLAIKELYGIEGKGKALERELIAIAEPWRPYRSYVCRALWPWRDR
ncbi:MAG: DNA-3-methyladenine glycosylase 2 family protein [Bacteroidia bacterium]